MCTATSWRSRSLAGCAVGNNIARDMTKCDTCGNWWSTDGEMTTCPCGGRLLIVNMEEHMKTLPRSPYDPSKDKADKKDKK